MNIHLPTKSITALASGSDPADLPQYVFAQLSNDTPTAERRNEKNLTKMITCQVQRFKRVFTMSKTKDKVNFGL